MKTVSFDDEAYNLLKGAKIGPDESFSDVVKRHFGVRRSLADSFGGWKDAGPDVMERLKRERVETFGTTGD
ncbi:MAG: antitoxin VapB family protein [Methanobacteriota archaeon]